jgi:hypothetical protein
MNCAIIDRDQRIDDFLQSKLSPEDAEAFEIHLFGCPECLAELRLREQMVKLIKEERLTAVDDYAQPQPSPQPRGVINSIVDFFRFRQNIWIYASAAAVLLVGVLIMQIFRSKEVPIEYAANFEEISHLESKVGQSFRSFNMEVSVISPAVGQDFTGNIFFRWELKKDGETFNGPVDLKIMNNREKPVHSAEITGSQYDFKQRLAPGLYYWSLENRGESLYLGKFFVKRFRK